jgi:hypothetical protein
MKSEILIEIENNSQGAVQLQYCMGIRRRRSIKHTARAARSSITRQVLRWRRVYTGPGLVLILRSKYTVQYAPN